MRTEFQIQRALQELMKGRTTFVIAQRLSTIKQADQILVLEQGRIVQRGQHDDLVAQPGPYRQIYDLAAARPGGGAAPDAGGRRRLLPPPPCRPARLPGGSDEPGASCRRGASRGGGRGGPGEGLRRAHRARTWAYVRPYRRHMLAATALMICIAGANLAQPFLIKIAIDQAIAQETCACWP